MMDMLSRISSLGPLSSNSPQSIVTRGLLVWLDTGLQGSYSGSGTTWVDISGGNDATLLNTPTYSTTYGGELTFSKSQFEYATVSNLGNISVWTIEAWIYFNSSPNAGTNAIITNQYDGINKVNFALGSINPGSNAIRAGFYDGTWRFSSGVTISTGQWYHFVGTYDGSTIKMYNNTVSVGDLSYSGTPQSGGEVRIARRWDDSASISSNFIDGIIPVVRIYNVALTSDEVKQNFNVHRSRYGV